MQHIHDIEQEGCFIYMVSCNTIRARSKPTVVEDDMTRLEFEGGELVCVDLVRYEEGPHGPFLRLADHSGWLFEKYDDQAWLKPVAGVEEGLWTFYIDNYPNGQYLRRHPCDSPDLSVETPAGPVHYHPMQLIYCDMKVTHPLTGINFYRVQGTSGWVYDKKKINGEYRTMLLEIGLVKTGLFAYRAIAGDMAVRNCTFVNDKGMTKTTIPDGAIVVVDVKRESLDDKGNGPFLRLADGSGWLFEHKQGTRVMEELPICKGLWEFCVLNPPVGMALRRHPIDSQALVYDTLYKFHEIVQCDLKIESPESGVNFFRVVGTQGWIFDKREKINVLELLDSSTSTVSLNSKPVSAESSEPWTPDFVRGIVSTIDGVVELGMQEKSKVLTYQTRHGAVINVFYFTRTVAALLDDKVKVCERSCKPAQLVDILTKDNLELKVLQNDTMMEEEKKEDEEPEYLSTTTPVEEAEMKLRHGLISVQESIADLKSKRRLLLKDIKCFDDRRAKACAAREEEIQMRKAKETQRKHETVERDQQLDSVRVVASASQHQSDLNKFCGAVKAPMSTAGGSKQSRASSGKHRFKCGECFEIFPDVESRDQHCVRVHKLYCTRCRSIFKSFIALEEHKIAERH